MPAPRPNLKFDHVFAIVRVDRYQMDPAVPSRGITVTKVLWSEEDADKEVARLNRVNAGKDCEYFRLITRLERRAQGSVES